MKFSKLFVILSILIFTSSAFGQDARIESGILDLRYKGVSDHYIPLTGEWEFYWETHLLPSDFKKDKELSPDLYMKVPSYWTDYSDDLQDIIKMFYTRKIPNRSTTLGDSR